ncbi:acyl-ACP--UDP-N-acetylglucosamine O-acyltransferase [bacterium]|nr:acyl-ACP--UDP-N-acetylglucosamine O-acyltransferase [bacterium]
MVKIHPTAIVSSRSDLGKNVHIGPNSIVGENVVIGNNTWIDNGVVLHRNIRIGSRCRIHTGAVLGTDPQDLKYKGENTFLEIGDRTIIREYVTVNLGTSQKGKTVVGSDVMLMAYVHVAHDCEIGDKVILANSVNMAGHVEIGEYAVVGGIVPIHQFVKIGCHAIIGGGYRVSKDVCPYVKAAGYPLRVVGLNTVGLKRRGFSPETMAVLKKAYVLIFRSKLNVSQAMGRIADELKQTPEILKLLNFIASSQRGIVR